LQSKVLPKKHVTKQPVANEACYHGN